MYFFLVVIIFICYWNIVIYFTFCDLPPLSSLTAFGFLFSDKCGFSAEWLILNKQRDVVDSVAGMAFLLAAERVQTGSYIPLDYIIGDTGISQGRYVER